MAEQIGRYEIRRELRRGGMATVYLAFDPRFRRQVAVKVLPRQFTHDPKYLERFEQEAQMIATLEHPAIVPVHDFGEHEDAPFLVMRYMAGGNLRDRLNGEPLPLEEITHALDRLAQALDHAHEFGIIHRDLKPANILFDYEGRPYLADFGIARMAEASHTMTIIGTPAYMSPEQVESEVKLDSRSDIYALGVILYEMLTGRQPYTAETPTGQMLMHITKPVPNVLETIPDLPPETQQVIAKAMAKDREVRYQSAGDLATGVNALLTSEKTTVGEGAVTETILAASAVEAKEAAPEPSVDEALVRPPTRIEPQAGAVIGDGAEKVDLYTPPQPLTGSEQATESVSSVPAESDEPPVYTNSKRNGFPGWIWWVGALALLVIAGFSLRSILGGGVDTRTVESISNCPGLSTDGKKLYLANGPTVSVYDADTQDLAWQYPSPDNVKASLNFFAAPSVQGDRVIFGDFGTSESILSPGKTVSVYARENIDNGGTPADTSGWTNSDVAFDKIVAPPLQIGDVVYVGTADNLMLALDANDGQKLWEFETGKSIFGQAAYGGGLLYVTSLEGILHALDAETGYEIWSSMELGGAIVSQPVLIEDLVYVSDSGGQVHAMEVQNGYVIWVAQAENQVWGAPTYADGIVYYSDIDGNVFAVDALTGEALWQNRVDGSVQTNPLVVNGIVYVTEGKSSENPNGALTAFDASNGQEIWRQLTSAPLCTAPEAVEDAIVVAMQSKSAILSAYDLESGASLWSIASPMGR